MKFDWHTGQALACGVAIGIGIGVGLDNIALGVAIGIAIGFALVPAFARPNKADTPPKPE